MTDADTSTATDALPGQVFPEQYSALLDAKAAQLKTEFSAHYHGPLDVFASPPSHFRMRAEFRVWHAGDRSFFAMFDSSAPRDPVEVAQFPMGSITINRLMTTLQSAITDTPELRYRLFQAEFMTTLAGDALVTLVYHRKLDDTWEIAARTLSRQLGIQLIGRSRKQKRVLDQDYVTET
ncbi:MAG: tRNA (uridine(54)-C5)-methyltransferase TrmA, partial [Natronospirillum sp.]